MSSVKATIVVPTTKDRGLLLPYSVGSILNQTVKEIEVFIIGDGVSNDTRQAIHSIQQQDSRVKFFDHPKHERRGEIYRHEALQQAKGEIIAYLCDRDLMLPNHIEELYGLLQQYNFVASLCINVNQDSSLTYGDTKKYFGAAVDYTQKKIKAPWTLPLSIVGHTLSFYHQLPYGWRTTPKNFYTDAYMWKQFMDHKDCDAYSHYKPTLLYFSRNNHPGWPTEKRLKELTYWSAYLQNEEDVERIKKQALISYLNEGVLLREKSTSLFLIKGYRLNELPSKILQKVASYLKKT